MNNKLNAKNKAKSVLTRDMPVESSKAYVANVDVFPDPPFVITIDEEVMLVVAKNAADNSLSVLRGYENTAPQTHRKNANVENRFTAGTITKIYEDIERIKRNKTGTLKKLLVWNANPSSINSLWAPIEAGKTFGNFDVVVFPETIVDSDYDGVVDTNYPSYSNVPIIIQTATSYNPSFEAFGTIYPGELIDFGVQNVKAKVTAWKNLGVKGIFWSDFSAEYFEREYGIEDFATVRQLQNTAMAMTHDAGLFAMVSSENVDDVFWAGDTIPEIEWWPGMDSFLLYDFPFFSGGSSTVWRDAYSIWYRTYRLNTVYEKYKVRLFAAGTIGTNAINNPTLFQTYANIAVGIAYSAGIEGLGIERPGYYGSNQTLLPDWKDVIQWYGEKQASTYSYYTNQSYTTSSGTTYNGLQKYVQPWAGGTTEAYYSSDGRTPIAYRFLPYFIWETDAGFTYYNINKMLDSIFEYSSNKLKIKFPNKTVIINSNGTITTQ